MRLQAEQLASLKSSLLINLQRIDRIRAKGADGNLIDDLQENITIER